MGSAIDITLAILTIIVPLFGGAFTVIMFYIKDVMEREPWILVAKTFLWGFFTGLFLIGFSIPLFMGAKRVTDNMTSDWSIILFMLAIVFIQAIFEETIKGLMLWRRCFITMEEIDGLFDGFFYGATIGTGAGVVDAIAYAILSTTWLQGFEIALIRTIRIPGTHALFTGLVGVYFTRHKFMEKKISPGVITAILLHTIWSIVTYLFHYYFIGLNFYGANFAFLVIYLLLMSVISSSLIKYDRKHFPEIQNDIKSSN